MPHYKLVASGRRPELKADEIILSRHEDSGDPEHMLSTRQINEIPDELLTDARNLASRMGFDVIEVEPGAENAEASAEQEPSADTAGQAPAIKPTGQSGAEIDQQATAKQGARAGQQDTGAAGTAGTSADASTTQSGTPATSATTSTTPPPSNT